MFVFQKHLFRACGFQFPHLTLSADGKSAVLRAGYYYEGSESFTLGVTGKVVLDEPRIDDLYYLSFYYSAKDGSSHVYAFPHTGYFYSREAAVFSEDGLLTFTVPDGEGTKTYQFVYFLLDKDGLWLTDGTNHYFYHSSFGDYSDKLSAILDEEVELNDLTNEQIEELVEKQDNVLEDLSLSFAANDVDVDLNADTGRVTLDSSFLFGYDSAALSQEGKDYLDSFVQAYASVILDEAHANDVAKILIEGHTDTDGNYEYNLALSERRAQAVADYCLSLAPELAPYLNVKGCSYDDPIFTADGRVDMAASRRVVFRFILNP